MSDHQATPFWRDERFLRGLSQFIALALVILAGFLLYRNMIRALEQRGMLPSMHFLDLTAGFDIGEYLISFSRSDNYLRAFVVGLLNTLQVSVLGIVFATILGIIVGVARLSTNYLVNKVASIYVEILRNIPLLVLLIFWYLGVFLKLPKIKEAVILPGPTFLSNRGVAIPWGIPSETFSQYLWILAIGVLLASVVAWWLVRQGRRTGRPRLVSLWSPLTFLAVATLGWALLPQAPLTPDLPYLKGLNTKGGR
ncbi:MAG: ABC transporter permease subunit, partial [Anaerolineales bacterium]